LLIGIFGAVWFLQTYRIIKYGDIPNISFTPDKELNILMSSYRGVIYF